MKRFLRLLVPLVLILVVLACTAWYFLVYDSQLTQELLLTQARIQSASGNSKVAAWLYDLAYFQSSQDGDVAIELANQYVAVGNYTQAERAISNAIAENATAELYTALSSLYVQQDKLLDAVHLLDTLPAGPIKDQLDAQRPQAPAASHAAGFYSQYISVEFTSNTGILFVSDAGQYPSMLTDKYMEPVALGVGETTLYCLSVAADGLVSPLSIYGYTVDGVVEPVTLADKAFDSALRAVLGFNDKAVIYTNDLWPIEEFTIPADATTYEDLRYLSRLKTLHVEKGITTELTHLSELTHLEALEITNTPLSANVLAAVGGLKTLQHLTLANCGISTVATLSELTGLQTLDLQSNSIRNLSALSGMTKLEQLQLSGNAITDLEALSALTNLKALDVSYNSVYFLDALASITGLESLKLGHNQIGDCSAVAGLTKLVELDLSFNKLTDVSALAACTELVELDLSNNTIEDITALDTMEDIEVFNIAHNQITQLPYFPYGCSLVTLDASYNLLETIDQLKNLPMLNSVNVDYNEALESLEPLDSCPLLITVNAFGTKVSDVSFLTENNILVNFNPVQKEEE